MKYFLDKPTADKLKSLLLSIPADKKQRVKTYIQQTGINFFLNIDIRDLKIMFNQFVISDILSKTGGDAHYFRTLDNKLRSDIYDSDDINNYKNFLLRYCLDNFYDVYTFIQTEYAGLKQVHDSYTMVIREFLNYCDSEISGLEFEKLIHLSETELNQIFREYELSNNKEMQREVKELQTLFSSVTDFCKKYDVYYFNLPIFFDIKPETLANKLIPLKNNSK